MTDNIFVHIGRLCFTFIYTSVRTSSSSSYYLQYALHMRSIIYCFGGVCAAASTILVVAIAKFGSYDKNRDKKQHA